jgi:hypothetical protein
MLREARRAGDLTLGHDPRWTELMAHLQSGDDLRIVDCPVTGTRKVTGSYVFYAVTRGDSIVARVDGETIN